VIRLVAKVGSALGAIEVTAALTGLLALGWLTAFGLFLTGTLSIWGSEKRQAAHGQRSRLAAAVVLDVAAVWTGVVAGADVGFEWALPAVGLAIVAVITRFGSAQPAASSGKEGRP
jgi:hypothetical protein